MAPNGHIISVSSSESYSSDSLNKGNLGNHDILSRFNNKVGATLSLGETMQLYRRSKVAQVVWSMALQRRLSTTEGGKVSQYTPVILPGGFGEMFDIPSMLFKFKVSVFGISNEEGAANIVWLAVAPEPASPGMEGLFWDRMEWKWVRPWGLDVKLQDELWDICGLGSNLPPTYGDQLGYPETHLTAMSDGARLHELWASALSDAATTLKSLVGSNGWVRVSTSNGGNGSLHKKGNVFRAVMEIDEGGCPGVDEWRAIFSSPELRKEWDVMTDKVHVLEVLDPATRVIKTDMLWDGRPISRTVHDASTIIDISTSLPRSPEEPAYLRPSPPYVRSHVHLQAWCIQLPTSTSSKTRITLFWQHDLRNAFSLSSSSPSTTLPALLPAIYSMACERATRAPLLQRWGPRSVIDAVSYDTGRAALRVDYTILPEDEHGEGNPGAGQREVELRISPLHAWEAQISTRAASEAVSNLPWTVNASRSGSGDENNNEDADRTVMRITHPPVPANSASSLKVKLVIELGGGSKGTLRINGAPHAVSSARLAPRPVLDAGFALGVGAEALSNISSSAGQANISGSVSSTPAPSTQSRAASITSTVPSGLTTSTRTAAAQKSIQTLIRRSYTYFTALLQEPDIKWRPLLESRGVTVTQLDSIDPTLVVYRAEATFVGVGVWDLLGVLGCEPARVIWEKNIEDARLIEDVSELSELWRVGWKAAWPVNPRDTIVLKTSYKSPTAAHVFSFSTSDVNLFPLIPPSELPTIRTHVDLHGFAIEALSPTTTLLTLLEQSSASNSAPWTGRGSGGVPASMVATLAGIGETVIRGGGAPPVVSRLSGAKKTRMRYDHDRGIWRIEYERSEGRTPTTASPKPEGERRRRWKQSLSGLGSRSSSLSRRAGESDEDNEGMGASVATIIPNSKRASSPSSSPESPGGRSLTPSSLSSRSLTPSSTSISSGKGIAFPTSEPSNDSNSTINGAGETSNPIPAPVPPIELELRVDPDNWAPLEIVVDPPPSAVRALRRHRLARGGGGLWITIEHAADQLSSTYGNVSGIGYAGAGGWDDRINVAVRKAAPPSPKDGNNPSIPTKDKDSPSEWEDQSSGGEGTRTPVRSAREELLRFHGERARAESTSKVMDSKSPLLADRPGHQRSNSLLTAPRIQTGRPTLVVNGARVKVDVEDLPEAEAKALAKAKRVKPMRIPLDEPPVLRTKREKPSEDVSDVAEGNEGGGVGTDGEDTGTGTGTGMVKTVMNWGMGMSSLGLGMGKMWAPAGANMGVGGPSSGEDSHTGLGITIPNVQNGVETAITSVAQPSNLLRLVTNTSAPQSTLPSAALAGERPPVATSLDALAFLTRQHSNNPTPDTIPTAGGWTPVTTKAGLTVTRRTENFLSTTLPVHRCAKVLQGVSAEDVASAISCVESRKQWDTWFDGSASAVLEEYGAGVRTEFTVLKGGFPFRDRGFYVSTLTARTTSRATSGSGSGSGTPDLIFLTSSSYNPASQSFAPGKVNPYTLPVGNMPLYGWVIETLDPYTAENYAIPSARCTLLYAWIMEVRVARSDPYSAIPVTNVKLSPYTMPPPSSPMQPPASAIEPTSSSSFLSVTSSSRKTPSNGGGSSGGTAGNSTNTSWGRASGSRFRNRARTLSSNAKRPDINSEGLIVAEFIIDPRLFPGGYDITTTSTFLSEKATQPISLLTDDDSSTTTTRIIPLRAQVFTLPVSPLRASAATTTPQSSVEVLDPLTGETRRGPEQPEWKQRLANEHAIVKVSIGPSTIKDKIRVDGSLMDVLSEKKSIVALGRAALEDDHVGYPLLGRSRGGPGPKVPNTLSWPVVAATHLYSDEPIVKAPPSEPVQKVIDEPTSTEFSPTEEGSTSAPKSPTRPAQVRRSSTSLFGFLSAYTNTVNKMPSITDAEKESKSQTQEPQPEAQALEQPKTPQWYLPNPGNSYSTDSIQP
ncbi:start domain-containing protein [Rhizoctonia solani]|uniref:Start domain-containing protein n=1 Tax=Rhizoctonia solani TaxID=456999 RepID=A0A8H8SSL8_9AGAM|nr:start domain-containing protein [Rhizoctonia solani]QRW16704.1 start domain-containing protein [Rhizoctonia solani]